MARDRTWACFLSTVAVSLLPSSTAACDGDRAPYVDEASPFGWPVVPTFAWDKQDCWAFRYPFCAGASQSPMNIELSGAGHHCETKIMGNNSAMKEKARYHKALESFDMVSHGLPHKPVVKVSKYMRTIMAEGPFGSLHLKDSTGKDVEYEATQVHLTPESLHTIDGVHYAAEMFIMHKPKGAKDMLGGGVVVSVLFNLQATGSSIFSLMDISPTKGEEWTVDPFGLADTLDPALMGPALQYNGSVPVPPCSETVTWFVLSAMQPVTQSQVDAMKQVLHRHAGGWEKRSPIARQASRGACRTIDVNGVQVSPNHEAATCAAHATDERFTSLPACMADSWHCGVSPSVQTAAAELGQKVPVTELVHYTPTEHVEMVPGDASLDGVVLHGGSFGHMMLNGRLFEAKKLSVRAISSHAIDGKRYAGELVVEHVLYGSAAGGAKHGTERDTAGESVAGHRRLGAEKHSVMLSVPLTLGKESPLLRHLRLGEPAIKEAIRDGNSYQVHQAIDLSSDLKASLDGPWYWYRTQGTAAHPCGDWHLKWMIFATPIEVSLEQLNDLSLKVSGMDTVSVLPSPAAPLWRESLPLHAAEPVASTQEECSGPWSYKSSHCWAKTFGACGGHGQSPVNIRSADVFETGSDDFLAKCSWKPVKGLNVTNSGRGLHVTNNQLGYFAYVSPEGTQDYYQVTGMKLHMPSEHMIDNEQFDAELQVVHQKQKAVNHLDEEDVAIASFMFRVGQQDSPLLKQFHLPGHAVQEGAPAKMDLPVDLMRALGPAMEGGYYRYDGSLTVPDCSEHAKWFVFERPLEMSQAQRSAFQALLSGAGNNRPVQELNGRRLAKNSFMQGTLQQYDFYLNRQTGRNRSGWNRSTTLILIPIIFTVFFTIYVMASLFVREDKQRMAQSSGGLDSGGSLDNPIGRQQPAYSRF